MTTSFASDPAQDFSNLYVDESAPKAADPTDALFTSLSDAAKAAASAQAPASGAATTPAAAPEPATPTASAAAPAASTPAAPQHSPEQDALLARLAPRGITSLDQLKGKSDVELRALSSDVVQYEMRQKSLNQFFRKNPDGTFDLTTGPDGRPTGLDASGKVIPPGGTATPAAKPATPAAKPAPAAKKAKKPAAKKAAPKRKAVVVRQARKKAPAKKPAAKKPAAPKVVQAYRPVGRGVLR